MHMHHKPDPHSSRHGDARSTTHVQLHADGLQSAAHKPSHQLGGSRCPLPATSTSITMPWPTF